MNIKDFGLLGLLGLFLLLANFLFARLRDELSNQHMNSLLRQTLVDFTRWRQLDRADSMLLAKRKKELNEVSVEDILLEKTTKSSIANIELHRIGAEAAFTYSDLSHKAAVFEYEDEQLEKEIDELSGWN